MKKYLLWIHHLIGTFFFLCGFGLLYMFSVVVWIGISMGIGVGPPDYGIDWSYFKFVSMFGMLTFGCFYFCFGNVKWIYLKIKNLVQRKEKL